MRGLPYIRSDSKRVCPIQPGNLPAMQPVSANKCHSVVNRKRVEISSRRTTASPVMHSSSERLVRGFSLPLLKGGFLILAPFNGVCVFAKWFLLPSNDAQEHGRRAFPALIAAALPF